MSEQVTDKQKLEISKQLALHRRDHIGQQEAQTRIEMTFPGLPVVVHDNYAFSVEEQSSDL